MSAIHCPNCGVLAGVDRGWKNGEPRKDGTAIVAMGTVFSHYDDGVFADPFVAQIAWKKTDSGYEGWLDANGLAVARMSGDEVHVNWWIDLPPELGSEVAA